MFYSIHYSSAFLEIDQIQLMAQAAYESIDLNQRMSQVGGRSIRINSWIDSELYPSLSSKQELCSLQMQVFARFACAIYILIVSALVYGGRRQPYSKEIVKRVKYTNTLLTRQILFVLEKEVMRIKGSSSICDNH